MVYNEEIDNWLLKHTTLNNLDNRTLKKDENDNIVIDIHTSIEIGSFYFEMFPLRKKNKELPFKFDRINGNFQACDIGLVSFKNFPNEIVGSFHAYGNNFKSNNEIPLKVYGRDYFITSNKALHGGNNLDLNFIKQLELGEKTELVLLFKNGDGTIELLDDKLLKDYKLLLENAEQSFFAIENSKDICLNKEKIGNIIKHPIFMDIQECDDYLNNFELNIGLNNDKS